MGHTLARRNRVQFPITEAPNVIVDPVTYGQGIIVGGDRVGHPPRVSQSVLRLGSVPGLRGYGRNFDL
jgi:hypothetical protein